MDPLWTPLDISTPIKMLLSHGSGPTGMISVQQTLTKQAKLICGSVVAPLGEKASPLEKDKAFGASKDWSLCPLELLQALLELLHAPLIWAQLELSKAPM